MKRFDHKLYELKYSIEITAPKVATIFENTGEYMGHGSGQGGYTAAPKTFFFETLMGIAIFATISTPAIGISFFVSYLETIGTERVIIYGLKFAEYLIFLVDLILFSRFMWLTFCRTWRRL